MKTLLVLFVLIVSHSALAQFDFNSPSASAFNRNVATGGGGGGGGGSPDITNGLVLDLKFNGNATDSSTNGNNGTWSGTTIYTNGVSGVANTAILLDGSSYINCGNGSTLNFTGNYTMTIWIKTTMTGIGFLQNKCAGIGANGYENYVNLGNYYQRNNGSINGSVPTTINDGAWHFVSGVYSNTVFYISIDGVAKTPLTGATDPLTTTQFFSIGSRNGGNLFTGAIDDARVYNTNLSPAQVNFIYTNTAGL